ERSASTLWPGRGGECGGRGLLAERKDPKTRRSSSGSLSYSRRTMRGMLILAAGAALPLALWMAAQEASSTGLLRTGPPLSEKSGPLRKPLLLLRQGKTQEAREELARLLRTTPDDAEVHHQIARSHLMDFYATQDPARKRIALSLALESLNT